MSNDHNHEQTNENRRRSPSQLFQRLEGLARQLEGISRDLADVLGQLAGRSTPVSPVSAETNAHDAQDRMLTITETAERMGLSEAYVYHKAKTWPFRRKLSARALRFSEQGLEAWLKENGRNGKSSQNEADDGDEEPAVGDVLMFAPREPAA